MIRYKVVDGTTTTYWFWNGSTPIKETTEIDGFGTAVANAAPIQTISPSQLELMQNTAAGWFIADEQDRRAIPDP